MVDPWIGFLNEEVSGDGEASPGIGRAMQRQAVLDRAACSFPFPLEVSFRAVVVDNLVRRGVPHLVLHPVGLSNRAMEVVGGLVMACDRGLLPASVVDVRCEVQDPDTTDLDEGVLVVGLEMDVIVPLEP